MPDADTAESIEEVEVVVPERADTEPDTGELEVRPETGATLFHTDDPLVVLQKAREVADAFKAALKAQDMIANIQGREHVTIEGWQTVGTMLGVVPVCTSTSPVTGDPHPKGSWGWQATVEARRARDGAVLGSADAMVTRSENTWKNRDDYALRSMAQTRAQSKALRSVLGFVVSLAGYTSTPAEEMPPQEAPPEWGVAASTQATQTLDNAMDYLYFTLGLDPDAKEAGINRVREHCGYLPAAAALSLVYVAQAAKNQLEAAAQ